MADTMRIFTPLATLVAGGRIANIVTGRRFEFISRPAAVAVYAVIDGVAPLPGDVTMNVSIDARVFGDALDIPVRPVASTGPNRNEHELVRFVTKAGRLIIELINNDAAAGKDVRTLIDIQAVA